MQFSDNKEKTTWILWRKLNRLFCRFEVVLSATIALPTKTNNLCYVCLLKEPLS